MRRYPLSKRLSAALLLGLLATIIATVPTLAGVTWCRADPIVKLGGAEYQVFVAVPEENVPQIDDALSFTFTSKLGSAQEILFLDAGFNGHGEDVDFAYSLFPQPSMFLDVQHTGETFPVLVEIYKNGKLAMTVEGTSDTITTALP